MAEHPAISRPHNQSRTLGRWTPRAFTRTAWWRFAQERRERYAARIVGVPTDAQAAAIQSMIALEWAALKHETAGTLASDKVAINARRLFTRLLTSFEKSLKEQPAEKPRPYRDYVAQRDTVS